MNNFRTHHCGELSTKNIGENVFISVWINKKRDHGGLLFIDLRDRSGLVQVSFGPEWTDAISWELAHSIGHEDVIRVKGLVVARPDGGSKSQLPTGGVELQVRKLEILSKARTPEIPVYRTPEEELPAEELRLQHRVLDLRRSELQEKLMLRH